MAEQNLFCLCGRCSRKLRSAAMNPQIPAERTSAIQMAAMRIAL